PMETLLVTYSRSAWVLAMACLTPEFRPWSRPKSRNALAICRSISSVRLFLRNNPAHMRGRYFTLASRPRRRRRNMSGALASTRGRRGAGDREIVRRRGRAEHRAATAGRAQSTARRKSRPARRRPERRGQPAPAERDDPLPADYSHPVGEL